MTHQLETRPAGPSRAREAPLAIAERIANVLAKTAADRDERGGTPKLERDLLRESGLLSLVIPTELGGCGAGWPEIFAVVRRLAQVDGSVAHVFGFQHLLLATLRLFAAPDQWRPWFEDAAAHDHFRRRGPGSTWPTACSK